MSDEEWERWKATYTKDARPIPPVLARARTDRARARAGMAGIYGLSLVLALPALRDLSHARTAMELANALLFIGALVLLVVGARLAMGGTIGRPTSEPLGLLAGLERRHAGRRRLIRFMPSITGFMVANTIGSAVASMIAARSFDLASMLETLVICGLAIWFVRSVMKRTGKLIDRELREAAEVRRLLTEGE